MPPALILDSNLLVLLAVGLVNPGLVSRHRRTSEYTQKDFLILRRLLENVAPVVVTPHILTEASNLARHIDEPHRGQISTLLGVLLHDFVEVHVPAREAAAQAHFQLLGLTDAAILSFDPARHELLTADSELYAAAQLAGIPALHMNDLREMW